MTSLAFRRVGEVPVWLWVVVALVVAAAPLVRLLAAVGRLAAPWIARGWRRIIGLLHLDRRVRDQDKKLQEQRSMIAAQAERIQALEAALVRKMPRPMPEYKGVYWSPRAVQRAGDQKNIPHCPWCYIDGREMVLEVLTGYRDGRLGLRCKHPGHSHEFFIAIEPADYSWAAEKLEALGGQAN